MEGNPLEGMNVVEAGWSMKRDITMANVRKGGKNNGTKNFHIMRVNVGGHGREGNTSLCRGKMHFTVCWFDGTWVPKIH